MCIRDRYVWVHRAALDRARPNQRDLDHEVVETARFQPRKCAHLRPALYLEYADRIGAAQHVVDALFLGRDRLQPPLLAKVSLHEIERVRNRTEHAKPEQIEFDEPHGGTVVLIPLQDRAVVHAPVLDRADLAHRPVSYTHLTLP